jgi:hypothetical protein
MSTDEIGPRHRRPLIALTQTSAPGVPEWLCLVLYFVVVAVTIGHHERWFDEAQAWLLARDLPYWDLLAHQLRYEGTPGLWHMLLFAAIRLGAGYDWISILGGAAAVTTAYVILRHSPFPRLIRCLLPFTFFLLFQYAVVARSYNLFAPILFGIAAIYPSRQRHPIVFGLLLTALSQVSVHGLLVAGALVAVEMGDVVRERRRPGAAELVSLALVAASAALVVWQLIPPADLGAAYRTYFSWDRFAVMTGTMIHNATAESPFLSELCFAISVYWLYKRQTLRFLLVPMAPLIALSAFRYHNVWHEGLIFLVWIFALWLGFQSPRSRFESPESGRRWTAALTAALLAVCVVQAVWAANAVAYDIRRPYSGSLALARFLHRPELLHARIHIDGFKPVAALPYFQRNIYANLNDGAPRAYWSWSTHNRLVKDATLVWSGNPDVVILTNWKNLIPRLWPPGYSEIARFPGALYWKNRVYEPDTYLVLRRSPGGPEVSNGR